MELNELLTVTYNLGYKYTISRQKNGYIIMGFNYYQWGLNLSSDKVYKTIGSCHGAAKNILNNHIKK